jgi:TetR/AcrR family transcriptional repressor of mexJK operon
MIHEPDALSKGTRERVLEAAKEAFLSKGYSASMDSIASRALVAKQTLYNHFASKDALFEEVVRVATESILVALDGDSDDLRSDLFRFAKAYRGATLSYSGIAMFRTLTSEAQRFPVLARAVYAVGPGQTLRQVALFMDKHMLAGRLRRDDPDLASEMLLGMLVGVDRTRFLLGVEAPPETLSDARTALIIDNFLRVYAPAP